MNDKLKELKMALVMTYGKKGKLEHRNRIRKEIARIKTKESKEVNGE